MKGFPYSSNMFVPLKSGARPNIPRDEFCSSKGVPSTVVPALMTLLVLRPPPACPGGGSSSPSTQEQVVVRISSSPSCWSCWRWCGKLRAFQETYFMYSGISPGCILEFNFTEFSILQINSIKFFLDKRRLMVRRR